MTDDEVVRVSRNGLDKMLNRAEHLEEICYNFGHKGGPDILDWLEQQLIELEDWRAAHKKETD